MKKVIYSVFFGLFSVMLIAGCATIVGKGGPEKLSINSNPSEAKVVILDESEKVVFEGVTPTTVNLDKSRGFFKGKKYTVKISKPGYAEHIVTVDTVANGWYVIGNLIFGGLIGWLIVDPATGAMWTLDINEINTTLTQLNKSSNDAILHIVTLDEVPEPLKAKMVKLTP